MGRYQVSDSIFSRVRELFWAGSCGEEETLATIYRYYEDPDKRYLIDPHTAVAANVLEQYRAETGDNAPAVFASTASPYKFCNHVLRAIGAPYQGSGMELIARLQEITGVQAPWRLAKLGEKGIRFTGSTEKQDMEMVVLNLLK